MYVREREREGRRESREWREKIQISEAKVVKGKKALKFPTHLCVQKGRETA